MSAALAAAVAAAPPARAAPVLPDFSPDDFTPGAAIDNPYYALVPGTERRYEADVTDPDTGEVTREVNRVLVTGQTREVGGVTARVVRDRAFEDGVLVEDTFDYFAQDRAGNVWYLGEDTTSFDYDDEGNIIGTSTAGSWHAGVNGARPGFIMPAAANRTVGFNYYQEFAQQDQALDQAQILSLDETVTVPVGTLSDVVQTRETTELEPDFLENKFYAPGVGEVLVWEDIDEAGVPLNRIPLVTVTVIPLPPAAWSAILATGLCAAVRVAARRRARA